MQNPNIVLYAPHTAKIEEKPIPTLSSPHDVVIRINYIGVCGSDVHFWHHASLGHPINPSTGITMGHEASGTIHAVGPSVTRVVPGDRVALEPGAPCRLCRACKSGSYNLCRRMRFAAAPGNPDTQGTLCKFYVLPQDLVYKVPEGLGLDEAVLVEPLAVAVHSAKLADVRAGETVVVMGGGTVGLLCAAVAARFGALRIVVVDVVEGKVEFARGYLGCETFLVKGEESAGESAERLLRTFGLGEESVDTVIEASGAAKSIETGILVLRPGGKFVQTGLGKAKVEFPIVVMSQKELLVRGCFRYGPGDYDLAIQLLDKGLVDVKPLISSVTPFEQATEAWEKTSRGEGIKNLIQGVI